MKCMNNCYSPMACGTYGYCRDRNMTGLPDEATAAEWKYEDNYEVLCIDDRYIVTKGNGPEYESDNYDQAMEWRP